MQITARPDRHRVSHNTPALRVMLLTDHPDGLTAHRLAGCGSLVETADELFTALSAILDDPIGFDLFVMDCDGFGGIDGAERAVAALIAAEARMRVMLVSREFDEPAYPLGRRSAVCLPETASDMAFLKGLDHVLRDRPVQQMM